MTSVASTPAQEGRAPTNSHPYIVVMADFNKPDSTEIIRMSGGPYVQAAHAFQSTRDREADLLSKLVRFRAKQRFFGPDANVQICVIHHGSPALKQWATHLTVVDGASALASALASAPSNDN